MMSAARIPQVARSCMGSCTAGGAYVPAMSGREWSSSRATGTIFLGGPPLVKAATGRGRVSADRSRRRRCAHEDCRGVADHFAEDEEQALEMCTQRSCLAPQRAQARRRSFAPRSEDPLYDPAELLRRVAEGLPRRRPYDVREVIARMVDGSRFHEFKERPTGRRLVCGFAHIHGYPVGDPRQQRRPLLGERRRRPRTSSQLCDLRRIPLLFLQNITGFMVGGEVRERAASPRTARRWSTPSPTPPSRASRSSSVAPSAPATTGCAVAATSRAFSVLLAELPHLASWAVEQAAMVLAHRQARPARAPRRSPGAKRKRMRPTKQPILDKYETRRAAPTTRPRGSGTTASSIPSTPGACWRSASPRR